MPAAVAYPSRPPGDEDPQTLGTATKKAGLTWGLGTSVPLRQITDGKVPFDVMVNLVYQGMLSELSDAGNRFPDFGDDGKDFSLGIEFGWTPE